MTVAINITIAIAITNAMGALASLSQCSSSNSRTNALTVDLVSPLCWESRARDNPGCARNSRNNTLRLIRFNRC